MSGFDTGGREFVPAEKRRQEIAAQIED